MSICDPSGDAVNINTLFQKRIAYIQGPLVAGPGHARRFQLSCPQFSSAETRAANQAIYKQQVLTTKNPNTFVPTRQQKYNWLFKGYSSTGQKGTLQQGNNHVIRGNSTISCPITESYLVIKSCRSSPDCYSGESFGAYTSDISDSIIKYGPLEAGQTIYIALYSSCRSIYTIQSSINGYGILPTCLNSHIEIQGNIKALLTTKYPGIPASCTCSIIGIPSDGTARWSLAPFD